MFDSPDDHDLLIQARQRIARLLERAQKDQNELSGRTKLDASAAGLGRAALKSVIAALNHSADAVDRTMQRKETS